MATLNIAVAGSSGRMGRMLIEAVQHEAGMRLRAALEQSGNSHLGQDAGEFAGLPCGVRISDDVEKSIAGCDVLIDFTRPEGTLAHLTACRAQGVKMVIGTTGLGEAQRKTIVDGAQDIAIVLAPNMAVGVNVCFKLAAIAARILGEGYDVEIIEAHHRHKVDAPSGTALRFGEIVATALGRDFSKSAIHGRSGVTGERDSRTIGFHAVRGGDIVGEHTVMFAGPGERVEITVRSGSRMTYALGALRAAAFLVDKEYGLYDMFDVLGLKGG